MRNLKKFLSLLLAVMMVATTGVMVSADDTPDYTEAATVLQAAGILKGYEDGELHLNDGVQRYQMALLLARILTGVIEDKDWSVGEDGQQSPFTDLEGTVKYNGAIDFCYMERIINGTSEYAFSPYSGIKYDEAIAMICRALGFTDRAYPYAYRNIASQIGLLNGIKGVEWQDQINRGVVVQLLYNMIKLVSGLYPDEFEYVGEYFTSFDSLAISAGVVDGKIVAFYSLESVVIHEAECPVVEADEAEKYYDYAGQETTVTNSAETSVVYFELPGGEIWALVDTGIYQVGKGVISFQNAEDKALSTIIARYIAIDDAKTELTVEDENRDNLYLSIVNEANIATSSDVDLTALKAETIYTFYVYGEGENAFVIDAVPYTPGEDLVVLKSLTPEILLDEEGNPVFGPEGFEIYTGNYLATVYALSSGFATEETITVRSIQGKLLGYDMYWEEDILDSDADGFDKLIDTYNLFASLLQNSAFICNATIDEFGKYSLTAAETYYGKLAVINDYATANAMFDIEGWEYDNDGNLKAVNGVRQEADAFINKNEVHKNNLAEGKVITLDKDLTYVVVNSILGTVNVFKGQPTEGDILEGNFIYDTVSKDGYVIVSTGVHLDNKANIIGTDTWTHFAPAQYVKVGDNGLSMQTQRVRIVSTSIVGIPVTVYAYNVTLKGLVDVNTEEAVNVTYSGLNEASRAILKEEVTTWANWIVPEYIYKFYTNETTPIQAYVPAMYFSKTTYADMWEDLDTYETVLEFVPGYFLTGDLDRLYMAFDENTNGTRYDFSKYGIGDIKLIRYIPDEHIDAGYAYDIGLDYDEISKTLIIKYLKRGVLVTPGTYSYDVNANGKIDSGETFEYELRVNMPGYWNNGLYIGAVGNRYGAGYNIFAPHLTVESYMWPTNNQPVNQTYGAYVEFGTNLEALEVSYQYANIATGDGSSTTQNWYRLVATDDAFVYLGYYGEKASISFKNGVATVEWARKIEEVPMVPNSGLGYLGDAAKSDLATLWSTTPVGDLRDNSGIDPNRGAYVYWQGFEDLSVQYQVFKYIPIARGYYDEVAGKYNPGTYECDFDEEIVTVEKWDRVNVTDWVIDTANVFADTDTALFEASLTNVYFETNNLTATWYAYGVLDQDTGFFEEYSKQEFLDDAKLRADGKKDKGIYMYELNLIPDYITFYLTEPCTNGGDKTLRQIAMIKAFEKDNNGNLVELDYDYDYGNTFQTDDILGMIAVYIDGGTNYVAPKDEVKYVAGTPASSYFKPVLNEGTTAAPAARTFNAMLSNTTIDLAARKAYIVETYKRTWPSLFLEFILSEDSDLTEEDLIELIGLDQFVKLFEAFIESLTNLYSNANAGLGIPGGSNNEGEFDYDLQTLYGFFENFIESIPVLYDWLYNGVTRP